MYLDYKQAADAIQFVIEEADKLVPREKRPPDQALHLLNMEKLRSFYEGSSYRAIRNPTR